MRPNEIENATFDTERRGYDKAQVDEFLARVAFVFRSTSHRYGIDWAVEFDRAAAPPPDPTSRRGGPPPSSGRPTGPNIRELANETIWYGN